jgi:hypothetical protein
MVVKLGTSYYEKNINSGVWEQGAKEQISD